MTAHELDAARALTRCRFVLLDQRRFVRGLRYAARHFPDANLTDEQVRYLWRLVWSRRARLGAHADRAAEHLGLPDRPHRDALARDAAAAYAQLPLDL